MTKQEIVNVSLEKVEAYLKDVEAHAVHVLQDTINTMDPLNELFSSSFEGCLDGVLYSNAKLGHARYALTLIEVADHTQDATIGLIDMLQDRMDYIIRVHRFSVQPTKMFLNQISLQALAEILDRLKRFAGTHKDQRAAKKLAAADEPAEYTDEMYGELG